MIVLLWVRLSCVMFSATLLEVIVDSDYSVRVKDFSCSSIISNRSLGIYSSKVTGTDGCYTNCS